MHNHSDASGGEGYLPHVVESSDVFLLLSVLLTEDSNVLFIQAIWGLSKQILACDCLQSDPSSNELHLFFQTYFMFIGKKTECPEKTVAYAGRVSKR